MVGREGVPGGPGAAACSPGDDWIHPDTGSHLARQGGLPGGALRHLPLAHPLFLRPHQKVRIMTLF